MELPRLNVHGSQFSSSMFSILFEYPNITIVHSNRTVELPRFDGHLSAWDLTRAFMVDSL